MLPSIFFSGPVYSGLFALLRRDRRGGIGQWVDAAASRDVKRGFGRRDSFEHVVAEDSGGAGMY